jgi:plasmid maintenance system antidote protein VapI
MSTISYLEKAKEALNIKSDYALAKHLGISRFTMSGYITGRRTIDNYTAAKLAEALDIDPMEIIAAAEEEREKDEKKRDFWRQIVQKNAAACLVLVGLFLLNQEFSGVFDYTYYRLHAICM